MGNMMEHLDISTSLSLCAQAAEPSGGRTVARRGFGRASKRKFYLVKQKAHSRPPGIELLNGKELFRDGYVTFAPPGLFERGFRTYPVRPRFRISTRLGRKLSDIEIHGNYWFVSD